MNRFLRVVLFLSLTASFITACKDKKEVAEIIPVTQKAINDSTSRFFINFNSYPKEINKLPIGIFDSELSGLSVVESFLKEDAYDNITGKKVSDGIADFSGENFIFLADKANAPYASYYKNNKTDYLRELIVRDALFLCDNKYYNLAIDDIPTGMKSPVKIIIAASKTYSSKRLSDIKTLISQSGVPIKLVGMVESTAEAALDHLYDRDNYALGVIAPSDMIASGIYENSLRNLVNKTRYTGVLQIFNQDAKGLYLAISQDSLYVNPNLKTISDKYKGPIMGKTEVDIDPSLMDRYNFDMSNHHLLYRKLKGEYSSIQLNSPSNYARYDLVNLIETHRRSGSKTPLSHIILGGNYYNTMLDTLNKVIEELRNYKRDGIYIYKNSIASNFSFIDPYKCVVNKCYSIMRENNYLSLNPNDSELSFYLSVPNYGLPLEFYDKSENLTLEYKLSRKPSSEVVSTKIVPFSNRYVEDQELNNIRDYLPYTYNYLKRILY